MPFRRPLTTVMGPPVEIPHCPNPSQEVIDRYHGEYLRALEKIFHQYAGQCDPDRKQDIRFVQSKL